MGNRRELRKRVPVPSLTTALGAALLAGLAVGIYHDLKETARGWHVADAFTPHMKEEKRQELLTPSR